MFVVITSNGQELSALNTNHIVSVLRGKEDDTVVIRTSDGEEHIIRYTGAKASHIIWKIEEAVLEQDTKNNGFLRIDISALEKRHGLKEVGNG